MEEQDENETRYLVPPENPINDGIEPNPDDDFRPAREPHSINEDNAVPQITTSEEETPSEGCLTACLGKLRIEHRRLLLFNILLLIWSALTAGLILLELHKAYGQCMLGMPLYAGGLDPRNVQGCWCKCPLYTIILTASVAWVSIMVNWVSDLNSKKAAFYKWLKWQAGLTLVALFGIVGSVGLTVTGFIVWCGAIQVALRENDDNRNLIQIPKSCYLAAKQFDGIHEEEFVKLYHTFFYTVGITIMIFIHLALWIGANYYTLRLLRVEPKDNQNAGNYPLSSAPHNTRYNPEASRNADAGRNADGGSRVNTGHQVDANRPRNGGELQINNDHQENGTL